MTPTFDGHADPTERFTSRVAAYREFRPRYPVAVLDLLRRQCELTPSSIIADIGAGTGMLAELFLQHGNSVLAVEPNRAMRAACEDLCPQYPKLKCIDGSAEAAGLPNQCADFVTVGQALHWFDVPRARAEFVRVLCPGGWCAVIYNERRLDGDIFHDGYERILKEFGTDYEMVRQTYPQMQRLVEFFSPLDAGSGAMRQAAFPNAQRFDLDGLKGRILSSSYMPQQSHPHYPAMMRKIEELFAQCQKDGHVRLEYSCVVSYSRLE